MNHDTGQTIQPNLLAIIDAGINYGQVSIILDETSSDETSSSSFESPVQNDMYSQHVSPLSSAQPSSAGFVQSSPEQQFTIISEPVIPPVVAAPIPIVTAPISLPLQHIVHYQPQLGPPQMPSTSKLTPNLQQPTATFVKYQSPMIMTSISTATTLGAKPVMSTVKVQPSFASPTPTIYSVMYTGGSGNKITLKRKPPDEAVLSPVTNNVSSLLVDAAKTLTLDWSSRWPFWRLKIRILKSLRYKSTLCSRHWIRHPHQFPLHRRLRRRPDHSWTKTSQIRTILRSEEAAGAVTQPQLQGN